MTAHGCQNHNVDDRPFNAKNDVSYTRWHPLCIEWPIANVMIPGSPRHLQRLGSGGPKKVEWLYLIPCGAVRQVSLESFVDESVPAFSVCVYCFEGRCVWITRLAQTSELSIAMSLRCARPKAPVGAPCESLEQPNCCGHQRVLPVEQPIPTS